MLTQDEEQRIRDTVRRSLDQILGERKAGDPGAAAATEAERVADANRVMTEETERYYTRMGLVKHLSRSGQVFWVTPAEQGRLERRRRKRRRSLGAFLPSPQVTLVWGATILIAFLLVVYLFSTELLGMLVD